MKYDKPDMTQGIWAESGTVAAVDPEKIALGWEVEKPPFEQANYVENRQDSGLAYVLQQGIPEWDAYTKYQLTSFVQYNGVVYKSLPLNNDVLNKQPNINPTYWQIAFTSFGDFLTIARATANGIDADLGVTNDVGAADFNTLTDVGVNSVTLSSTNSPYDNFTGVVETRVSSGIIYQIAQGKNTTNSGWATRYYNGTDWQAWVLYATKSDIATIGVTTTSLQTQINALTDALNAAIEAARVRVGGLYFSSLNTDPATELGYGTWLRYAEGRAIVGYDSAVGTSPTHPDWTKVINGINGNYSLPLALNQVPVHNHDFLTSNFNGDAGGGQRSGSGYLQNATNAAGADRSLWAGSGNVTNSNVITPVGGTVPVDLVQPSIVVAIWRRIT